MSQGPPPDDSAWPVLLTRRDLPTPSTPTKSNAEPTSASTELMLHELTDAALAFTEGHANYMTNVSRMRILKAEFGDCAAESITPEQFETWLKSKTEWAVATKNRYIALMKLVYRIAERAQRIKYNPARLVRQQKENNARIRWLSDKEEAALCKVIRRDCPERILEFEIALHTGMRRSEQYRMQCEYVDLKNGLITIPQSKPGSVRYVRMNSRVNQILSGMKKTSKGTGRVFELVSPRSWFDPAVKAAGVQDFSWHCLRHTFISRLVMAGVDLRTVQEAGHKNIAMTCRYAHLVPSHQQAALEKLVVVRKRKSASATTTATRQLKDAYNATATLQ